MLIGPSLQVCQRGWRFLIDHQNIHKLKEVKPIPFSPLQEILSLADACGVPALCDDVIGLVMVTSANVAQWLPWLLQEHGSINVEPIQKQVGEVSLSYWFGITFLLTWFSRRSLAYE